MPSVPLLVEVIGGPTVVLDLDPSRSVGQIASDASAAVGRSLADEDGTAKAWRVFAPKVKGGFAPAKAEDDLVAVARAMQAIADSGEEGGFAGPGKHEGRSYLFRIRLFVPSLPPPKPVVEEPPPIEDAEAIDLTNLDVAADELETVRHIQPRPQRKRRPRPRPEGITGPGAADGPRRRPEGAQAAADGPRRRPDGAAGPVGADGLRRRKRRATGELPLQAGRSGRVRPPAAVGAEAPGAPSQPIQSATEGDRSDEATSPAAGAPAAEPAGVPPAAEALPESMDSAPAGAVPEPTPIAPPDADALLRAAEGPTAAAGSLTAEEQAAPTRLMSRDAVAKLIAAKAEALAREEPAPAAGHGAQHLGPPISPPLPPDRRPAELLGPEKGAAQRPAAAPPPAEIRVPEPRPAEAAAPAEGSDAGSTAAPAPEGAGGQVSVSATRVVTRALDAPAPEPGAGALTGSIRSRTGDGARRTGSIRQDAGQSSSRSGARTSTRPPDAGRTGGGRGRGRGRSSNGIMGLVAALLLFAAVTVAFVVLLLKSESPDGASADANPTPSALRLSDALLMDRWTFVDPSDPVPQAIDRFNRLGAADPALAADPTRLAAVQEAARGMAPLCSGGTSFAGCLAWSRAAFAAFQGCRVGDCTDEVARAWFLQSIQAADQALPPLRALDGGARVEGLRQLTIHSVRLAGQSMKGLTGVSPQLATLARQACEGQLSATQDCKDAKASQ